MLLQPLTPREQITRDRLNLGDRQRFVPEARVERADFTRRRVVHAGMLASRLRKRSRTKKSAAVGIKVTQQPSQSDVDGVRLDVFRPGVQCESDNVMVNGHQSGSALVEQQGSRCFVLLELLSRN
jgi:hypothetical protein